MIRRSALLLALSATLQATATPALAFDFWPGEWSPGRPSINRSIEAPDFILSVPFRTQRDGGPWEASNCGPAVLGMVLDGFGIVGQTTDDLRFRSHTYQDTVGQRTGTGLQHLAHVAEDFGLSSYGLYAPGGDFRSWTAADLRAQLQQGRPVVVLVRLHLLPGYTWLGPRWAHYVLVTGQLGDDFVYSDPYQTDPRIGRDGRISAEALTEAMQRSPIPGQAVAFSGLQAPNLPLRYP